jgi:predicted glycogen debranching enzyme
MSNPRSQISNDLIHFSKETCSNLDAARSREWLETNGLGGFASSTIVGLNTRRYHGLLVAAIHPPVGRTVLLSKLDETLVIDGRRFDLSTNQYPGTIHPQGYALQTNFKLDPFPTFSYRVEDIEIEKSLFMIQSENAIAVRYQVRDANNPSRDIPPGISCSLELAPLVPMRDYHSLRHEDQNFSRVVTSENSVVTVKPYEDQPALCVAHDSAELETTGFWYRSLEYSVERERGFDFTEDLFNPFVLKFNFKGRSRVGLIASTEPHDASLVDRHMEDEVKRRRQIVASSADNAMVRSLTLAADQFIVARGEQKTVIAGYHWFSDWGRDTMIALPGLALTTGRTDVARSILIEFAKHVDKGMLPNRFPDAGEEPEYNTVDATLWYFEAVRALVGQTGDYDFVRENLYDVLVDIIDWHIRGTRYNIHLDKDGLLAAGEEGVQLTWMDAKVGDWVVTPRRGKPVEIQALWYNALRVMARLAKEFQDDVAVERYMEMASRARDSFNLHFWNEELGCLYDVIEGDNRDASIRPNQIFAVSLHRSMLPVEKAQRVVETVRRELLTPYGLRSLAVSDPKYRGRYEGDGTSRDGAYHQGTVWAWLIGPFITAYLKAFRDTPETRVKAAAWLMPFERHLSEAGLNQVSEIFDGDSPHKPGGCIAQAWSVAELLRVVDQLQQKA